MEVLGIIPARGGSQGIHNKNTVRLSGKPLITWTLDAARTSRSLDRIIVSSDCAKVRAVATECGVEVMTQPNELSGPDVRSDRAVSWALAELGRLGYSPDVVVLLQATSPLREANDIDRAVALLGKTGLDSLFSACRLEGFVWLPSKTAVLEPMTYDFRKRPMRSEARHALMENGSLYVTKKEVWLEMGCRLGGRIGAYVMDPLHSFQVDTEKDLEFMERLMLTASPDWTRDR